MRQRSTIAILCACTALAACSGRDPDRVTNATQATPPANQAEPTPATTATATPAPAPAPAPAPVAATEAIANPLPLKRGVYVVTGSGCSNPANAAIQIYDGSGLSGATTRACRNRIVSKDGDTYVTDQSCENTYDGSRTTERQRLRIPDATHFTVIGAGGSVSYAICPRGTAPDFLERIAG